MPPHTRVLFLGRAQAVDGEVPGYDDDDSHLDGKLQLILLQII